jgi:hypothetical protein
VARNAVNFAYEVSYLQRSVTCRDILRHGTDGLTSPPKEVVVWTFIAIINVKHTNH